MGCCASVRTIGAVPVPTSTDPIQYAAQLQQAASAQFSAASSSVQATIDSQTSDAAAQARIAQGAASAADLAQHGFNPNDPADNAKLIHAVAGGLCLVPGVGPLLGAYVEGLYLVGNVVAGPVQDFFAGVGLGVRHDAPPCQTSGNWTPAGILSQARGVSIPKNVPSGSFADLMLGALAMYSAQTMNCKGGIPAGVVVDAVVSIWNKSHAGPLAPYFVPPIAVGGGGVAPEIVTAWEHVSDSSTGNVDPNVFYAFQPTANLRNVGVSNINDPSKWWPSLPYPIAPDLPGQTHTAPRIVQVNTGAPLAPAPALTDAQRAAIAAGLAKMQAANLTDAQRAAIAAALAKMQAANLTDAQRAAIAAGLAKMQAPAMSSGAKVAAVGAAGAGAALLWWFASHGWRWVTPRFLKR